MFIKAIPISNPVLLSVNEGKRHLFSIVLKITDAQDKSLIGEDKIVAHLDTDWLIGLPFADLIALLSVAKEIGEEVEFETTEEDASRIMNERKFEFYKVILFGQTHDFYI
jgi:hypothetical protein